MQTRRGVLLPESRPSLFCCFANSEGSLQSFVPVLNVLSVCVWLSKGFQRIPVLAFFLQKLIAHSVMMNSLRQWDWFKCVFFCSAFAVVLKSVSKQREQKVNILVIAFNLFNLYVNHCVLVKFWVALCLSSRDQDTHTHRIADYGSTQPDNLISNMASD